MTACARRVPNPGSDSMDRTPALFRSWLTD